MLSPQIQQQGYDLRIGLDGEMMRGSGELFESPRSVFKVAIDPFVTGLPGNIIPFAEFGGRKSIPSKISDELNFLVHR
jgi:hypothetical protein